MNPPADPTSPALQRRRRRGLFWPLVLIGTGFVFLLGNYGLIQPVSLVTYLALWPVLLILLGIDIAFARRWPFGTLVAEVVIIGLALLLAATQPSALTLTSFSFSGSSGCTDPRSSVSVPRGSLQSAAVSINAGAARYHVSGGASGAVEATADFDELCLSSRDTSGTRGDLRLTQGGTRLSGANDIAVKLASDLPITLTVNAGAGEFDFDLHDVKIASARMNIGASSVTVTLPHPSGDVAMRSDGGATSIVIVIPSDVEARIVSSGGLVSTSTSNARTTKSGDIIETAGYATAKDRVTFTVNGGVNSVSIQ